MDTSSSACDPLARALPELIAAGGGGPNRGGEEALLARSGLSQPSRDEIAGGVAELGGDEGVEAFRIGLDAARLLAFFPRVVVRGIRRSPPMATWISSCRARQVARVGMDADRYGPASPATSNCNMAARVLSNWPPPHLADRGDQPAAGGHQRRARPTRHG